MLGGGDGLVLVVVVGVGEQHVGHGRRRDVGQPVRVEQLREARADRGRKRRHCPDVDPARAQPRPVRARVAVGERGHVRRVWVRQVRFARGAAVCFDGPRHVDEPVVERRKPCQRDEVQC